MKILERQADAFQISYQIKSMIVSITLHHMLAFFASSISLSFSLFAIICWFLIPITPPVESFLRAALSLYWALKFFCRVLKSYKSSFFTSVNATTVAVLVWTSFPSLDFDLTTANGTSFFLQRAGRNATSSTGSTSWAITTSLAFPSSTRLVTWLRPNFKWIGFGPTCSSFFPAFLASASA